MTRQQNNQPRNRTILPLFETDESTSSNSKSSPTRTFRVPLRSKSFQPLSKSRCRSHSPKKDFLPTFHNNNNNNDNNGNKGHTLEEIKNRKKNISTASRLASAAAATCCISSAQSNEKLPKHTPFFMFFMPNFVGIFLALGIEALHVEWFLSKCISKKAHPYALLGLGIFCIVNTNSYLSGSVAFARIRYGVNNKMSPNLYTNTTNSNSSITNSRDPNIFAFNCIQRGHQNFVETYAQLVLSVLFTATIRPNTAGVMLIIVAIARVLYSRDYKHNIDSRVAPLLVAMLTMSIGPGYAVLLALSAFGIQLLGD